jgi:hypothetical protein
MRAEVAIRTWPILFGLSVLAVLSCKRESIPPPTVPENLKAPEGHVLLKALGKGVQIYACKTTANDPVKFAWTFKAPEAELKNNEGENIGKHYVGPTWEATDGSKVVGALQQQAASPDPNAIPWLLLKAKSNEGTGTFSKVTYIQRVDTAGGKAPSDGCDQTHANAEARIDYTAYYYFYV